MKSAWTRAVVEFAFALVVGVLLASVGWALWGRNVGDSAPAIAVGWMACRLVFGSSGGLSDLINEVKR